MAEVYDMCVDYDILCDIEDKLQKIGYDLNNSTEQMNNAIRNSQEFLAGNQFEKAKNITSSCISITNKTRNNIRYAVEYIDKLRNVIDEYVKCEYSGDL